MPFQPRTFSNYFAIVLILFAGNLAANSLDLVQADTTFVQLSVCESACPLPSPFECTSGIYEELLLGSDGCDSLIIIDLTIVETMFRDYFGCEGDCFNIPELDSLFCPPASGQYFFEYNGCEEGLVYSVFFDNINISDVYVSTCEPGECFVLFPFDTICPKMDTTLSIPIGTCGDFYSLIIEVNEPSPIDSFIFNSCPEDCVVWDGGVFCNDFSSLTVLQNPETGCDSSIYFEANFYTGTNPPAILGICENECITWNGLEFCEPTTFIDSLTTANGCDSIVNITTEIIPLLPQLLPNDTIINIGEKLTFNINLNNFSVFWNSGVEAPSDIFDSDDFGVGVHNVFATIVENSTGCLRVTDTTIVEVIDPNSAVVGSQYLGVKVYPNPVLNNENIQLEVSDDLLGKTLVVTFYGSSGTQFLSYKMPFLQSNNSIQLPEQIPSGIYFLELFHEGRQTVQKIIVH